MNMINKNGIKKKKEETNEFFVITLLCVVI